ncbi:MAG TPA: helix-turn-helix transcriptional regulator [Mariprofundaceae bacterium]|nr:helix-turn-helix transcriptional regulator [Mariprofundaceae bacterium]
MTFGERLKSRRIQINETQQSLAEKVGMTKASISGLELGSSKKPSSENLLPLARALGVNPEWLITGKGQMQSDSVREPSAEYALPRIPWPDRPEQINMAMIEDIARRVSDATGADIRTIRNILTDTIIDHYENQS